MSPLFETILVRENRLQNLAWHNARVNLARKALFQHDDNWDLARLIQVPVLDPKVVYRCRFVYAQTVEKIEFLPYTPRIIKTLYLVEANHLDYAFKYANREALEDLKKSRVTASDADILIVKDGLVTDTSFSNIVFNDGTGWVTPDSPLLRGTKRARYLDQGLIRERRITPADLSLYRHARLINAMLDLETGNDIDIRNILA